MASPVLKFSTIENSYAALWNAFSRHGRNAKGSIKPLDSAGFKCTRPTVGTQDVQVTGMFLLSDWLYRSQNDGAAKNSLVDIIAGGYDRYDCSAGVLSQSTVKVKYLQAKGSAANRVPLLQLHYDFQTGQGPRHPIFHAQFSRVKFDPEHLKRLRIPADSVSEMKVNYPAVRIPTPRVGLAGLLISLAADHWPDELFEAFLTDIRKLDLISWPAECDQLQRSFNSRPGFVHTHHWYGRAA